MSLADQSQQFYPTSVQVTVFQARNLRIKGKNGTNDAYAIMQVAKDKFSTSVAEKCVAPVWKEEATFDLPLFHHANVDRCTLHVIVMHRASVGLDKLLGQAVINLIELHDNRSRKKAEWHKLVDKGGKTDKDRGEVLLDIQFMRNSMTASMFDLSARDKPRSRISKLKDKVRGKNRDSFSDSASAIVPSVSQVLTDSEGDGDSIASSPGTERKKKKSKLKSLFAPKSNLQRNVSQSMSTLGSLPEKNGTLSGSRSSGLNVDSPNVKKKFKFLGHKRTDSSDSKVSLGAFSLLGRSKQNIAEQNNLCINGNHVYTEEEEPEPSFGSTPSLTSSRQGSPEDIRKSHQRNASDASTDSFRALTIPSYNPESTVQRPLEDRSRRARLEEEEEEERRKQEEGRRLQDILDRQEEQEKKKMREREERRKQEEEERRRRLEEQERRRKEEAEEEQRKMREEEARKAEELKKQQEEVTVTDRLSSLFGLGKKKEEPEPATEPPALEKPKHLDLSVSPNPFEEISLTPEAANSFSEETPADMTRGVWTPHPPASGGVFSGRTARVSAVKPRLTVSLNPEPDKSNPFSPNPEANTTVPSSTPSPDPTPDSDPLESFDMFSNLHSSMAPPKSRRGSSESLGGSSENLAATSEKKRRAPLPPGQTASSKTEGQSPTHGGGQHDFPIYGRSAASNGHLHPIEEVDIDGDAGGPASGKVQRPSLPLPDYESLYPKRRHGVIGQTRWDNIIAEVSQRRVEYPPELIGREMSVDGPDEPDVPSSKTAVLKERTSASFNLQRSQQEPALRRNVEIGTKQAILPPKPAAPAPPRHHAETDASPIYATVVKPKQANDKPLSGNMGPTVSSRDVPSSRELDTESKVPYFTSPDITVEHLLFKERPVPAARTALDRADSVKQGLDGADSVKQGLDGADSVKHGLDRADSKSIKHGPVALPSVKPRKKPSTKEPVELVQPDVMATPIATPTEGIPTERLHKHYVVHEPAKGSKSESGPVSVREPEVTDMSGAEPSPFTSANNTNAAIEKPLAKVSEEQTARLVEPDPFPNDGLIPRDSWAIQTKSTGGDDLLNSGWMKTSSPSERGLTPDDLDGIFSSKDTVDPFLSFGHNDLAKSDEQGKTSVGVSDKPKPSVELSTPKRGPQTPSDGVSDKVVAKAPDHPKFQTLPSIEDVELTVTSTGGPNAVFGEKNQDVFFSGSAKVREEPWLADPFTSSAPSATLASPVVPKTTAGESSPMSDGPSGGKTLLRAWVSPSEVQTTTSQSGGGGGPASTPRRPHPVKPLSSTDSQMPNSLSGGKDLKPITIQEVAEKSKAMGPYTQLTQEELITLVVKQQTELSKKDTKIMELEDYIDNLLVRVMDDHPNILLSLNGKATH